MPIQSNMPDLIAKLERVKANVLTSPDISDAMLSAINAGMGKMKFRIFNKGLDAEGVSLGKYTGKKSKKKLITPYEEYRVSRGRQIGYKDLEMEGSLRRSIQTAKVDNNKVVIAITNDETAKIAGYQEIQIGKIRGTGDARIFTFSESEFEFVKQEGNAAIKQVIQKLFEQ